MNRPKLSSCPVAMPSRAFGSPGSGGIGAAAGIAIRNGRSPVGVVVRTISVESSGDSRPVIVSASPAANSSNPSIVE